MPTVYPSGKIMASILDGSQIRDSSHAGSQRARCDFASHEQPLQHLDQFLRAEGLGEEFADTVFARGTRVAV